MSDFTDIALPLIRRGTVANWRERTLFRPAAYPPGQEALLSIELGSCWTQYYQLANATGGQLLEGTSLFANENNSENLILDAGSKSNL
jgi:hypothetical protein